MCVLSALSPAATASQAAPTYTELHKHTDCEQTPFPEHVTPAPLVGHGEAEGDGEVEAVSDTDDVSEAAQTGIGHKQHTSLSVHQPHKFSCLIT